MAEKKVHKKEVAVKKEPTPQKKKARDMRASGLSLREISENLNIPRKQVEELCAGVIPAGRGPASKEEAAKDYKKDQANKADVKDQKAVERIEKRKINETHKGK